MGQLGSDIPFSAENGRKKVSDPKCDASRELAEAHPPERLEVVGDLVHRLKRISEEQRQAIFTRTAGAFSDEEADELERVIEEGCEQIDRT